MAEPHAIGPRGRLTVIYDSDGRSVAAARDPYVDQIAALPLLLELARLCAPTDALARRALDVARLSHTSR